MKAIGLALLTGTFPNCLDLKETSLGYPPDFHLKDALAYVLDNTTSRVEQDKEFQGFQRDLLNLQYKHEPNPIALTSSSNPSKGSKEDKTLWPHTPAQA